MKRFGGCQECDRLWHEHSLAITEHIRREGKLRLARLKHDDDGEAKLMPAVDSAREARRLAREAILTHEQSAHSADSVGAATEATAAG